VLKKIFFLWCISLPAWAISVGEMTYFMGSEQAYLSKSVVNDSAKARYYQVTVEESAPPYEGAVEQKVGKGALLYGPKQLLLRPNETKYLKLYYQGPQDDQPRYYRVTFHERPSFLMPHKDQPYFSTTASLSTILVVQPRKPKQAYQLKGGVLTNTGNTVYLAYVEGDCVNKAEKCVREKYLIPGGTMKLEGFRPDTATLFLSNEKINEYPIAKETLVQ
jgi:Mat/Ecp fimbriae periplasmic chaperone